jgi:hypothetical protein
VSAPVRGSTLAAAVAVAQDRLVERPPGVPTSLDVRTVVFLRRGQTHRTCPRRRRRRTIDVPRHDGPVGRRVPFDDL